MNHSRTYRTLVLEPSEIVAAGLRNILAGTEFRTADPTADELHDIAAAVRRHAPDVVVVNPSLLSDAARRTPLRTMFPQLQEVALAAFVHTLYDEEQMRGFDAVITIFDTAQQVLRKLRKALDDAGAQPQQNDTYELSEREREILVAVARGLTNKEIADQHNISIHTVISHRKNISRKTGIKTIAGLTVYALLNNMISEADMEQRP